VLIVVSQSSRTEFVLPAVTTAIAKLSLLRRNCSCEAQSEKIIVQPAFGCVSSQCVFRATDGEIFMQIAIDAMGGDFAPGSIVSGAVQASKAMPELDKIILVGDESAIRKEYKLHKYVPENIEIRHASEVVGMDESPVTAVRRKKDSSISRAIDLVKAGEAQAMISAGNTGAVMAAAKLKLRTIEGIERPAIAAVMPTPVKPFVLIDAGANTDCSPELLFQFAVMGNVYAREILGRPDPLIGLMSVGSEDSKGNETTREAFRILEHSNMNFRGNIEGHD